MRRPRRNHSATFKAKVALEAVRGELPLAELAEKYDVHATQIAQWKADLIKGAEAVFDGKKPDKPDIDVQRLHAKIGELVLPNDFFRKCTHQSGQAERKKMIDPTHKLSIARQAKALGITRSAVYYKPAPISDSDLALMAAMDRLHLDYPFAGARMLRNLLRRQGSAVGHVRVTRLMKKMSIEAIYRKSNTSRRSFAHKVYPYLLRNLTIDRVNQVWAMDITYLSMKRGFLYLAAVIDWHSRKILSFKLSNTMHRDFCIEAAHEAIQKYGVPEIMNADQVS